MTNAGVTIITVPSLETCAVSARVASQLHTLTEPHDIALTSLMYFPDLVNCFRNAELTSRRQLFFVLGQTFRVWRVCLFLGERATSRQKDETQTDGGYRYDVHRQFPCTYQDYVLHETFLRSFFNGGFPLRTTAAPLSPMSRRRSRAVLPNFE